MAKVTSYDGLREPLIALDRKGQTTTFTYDAQNRPSKAAFADGITELRGHDTN